jgi:hypothetical protein
MSQDGSDNESGASGASRAGGSLISSKGKHMQVKVLFTGKKLPRCCLCKACCSDDSPFLNRSCFDKYGGKRPWRAYVKVYKDKHKKELLGKKPTGKQCLICSNLYRNLGAGLSCGVLIVQLCIRVAIVIQFRITDVCFVTIFLCLIVFRLKLVVCLCVYGCCRTPWLL